MMSTRVTFNLTYKHNLGNFENVDIQVGVETDSLPGENVNEAFERVAQVVYTQLHKRLDETVDALEDK
jgi:GTPase SAR1 family protein